jgi:uncharacterized protein YukE
MLANTAGVRRLAGTLRTATGDVTATSSAVDATVGRLVPGSWDGPAAADFQAHWRAERAKLGQLSAASGRMATTLEYLADMLDAAAALAATSPEEALAWEQRAWAQATADLASVMVPPIDPTAPGGQPASSLDSFTSWWQGVAQWWKAHGADLGNVASDGVRVVGDAGLMAAGLALFTGGTGLDATGAGAVVGVPAQALGVAAAAAGALDSRLATEKLKADMLKLFSTRADVQDEFDQAQQQADPKDVEQDVLDQPGMKVTDTPGGAPQPESVEVGNFAHANAEQLIPESRLPRGLDSEFTMQTRGGEVRLDRVDWRNGTFYEIKPNDPANVAAGSNQVGTYTDAMNRQFPLGNGRSWQGQVVTYDYESARTMLFGAR